MPSDPHGQDGQNDAVHVVPHALDESAVHALREATAASLDAGRAEQNDSEPVWTIDKKGVDGDTESESGSEDPFNDLSKEIILQRHTNQAEKHPFSPLYKPTN